MAGDVRPSTPSPSSPAGYHRWACLATLSVGISLIMVDSTIVNVALPTMISDLGMTSTAAEWLNSGYVLAFAALLLPAGRIGDIIGHRRLFALGVVTFVMASILAGQGQSATTLLLSRALQGVGSAMILPATLSTINATFRGRDRAMAFGVWGTVIGGTVAIGPVLGGWLTADHSWRWIFYINLPLGALVLLGILWFVPETRDPNAGFGMGAVGTFTASAGIAALVFVLIEGQRYGWWSPTREFTAGSFTWPFEAVSPIPSAAVAGVACLALFIMGTGRRRRQGKPVLIDLSLFTIPSFRIGTVAIAIVSLAEFGLMFVLPLFLQAALGHTALRSGLVILALAVGALLAGPAAGPLTQRHGARRVVLAGILAEAVALAGLGIAMSLTIDIWLVVGLLFVYGIGVGLASAQLSNIVLADVPTAQSGQASGVQSTTRLFGSALGIALLGTVLVTGLSSDLTARLEAQEGLAQQTRTAMVDSVRDSLGTVIPRFSARSETAEVGAAAEQALTESTRKVILLAAAFMLVGFLLSLRLPRNDPREAGPDGPGSEPEAPSRRPAARTE